MAFLKNKEFLQIREAAKNGNVEAQSILKSFREGKGDDLDGMVKTYFDKLKQPETPKESVEMSALNVGPEVNEETIESETTFIPEKEEVKEPPMYDLTNVLDDELKDIFEDNDEYEDLSFKDYLKKKELDSEKERKNAGYFKIYDQQGRNDYLNSRIDKKKQKMDSHLKDIGRRHNDINKSLETYTYNIMGLEEDGVDTSEDLTKKAYKDFLGNEKNEKKFGRHWDKEDTDGIVEDLKMLVSRYGKNNVLSALGMLMNDNNEYKDFKEKEINEGIEKYRNSLESLLK